MCKDENEIIRESPLIALPSSANVSPSRLDTLEKKTIFVNFESFDFTRSGNDLVHQYDRETKLAIFP
jgi:hypothetical protein